MFEGTTIIAVKKEGETAIAGDGQVTIDETIMKNKAAKLRKLEDEGIIAGFAGGAADSMALFSRFEEKLSQYSGNLKRAAVELAKDWRTDKLLRKLQALMLVADSKNIFLISGNGDLLEPDKGVIAIGSGGGYAQSAASALLRHTDLAPEKIAEEAVKIASTICVYTNDDITVHTLKD